MIMFVIVLFYIFIRYKCYKKIVYNISAAFIAVSSFFLLKFVVQEGIGTSEFQLFHFFSAVVQGRNQELSWLLTLILFIIIYFSWSITFIILESINLKTIGNGNFIDNFKSKKTIKIEIVILLCIAGILPGMILKIHGGSANYFSELQKCVSIILLLSLIISGDFAHIDIRRIIKKPFKVLTVIIIIILVSGIIYNFYTEFKSFYDDYRYNKEEYKIIKNNDIEDELALYRVRLIEVLLELDNLSIREKRDSLLYIPVDNTEFWDLKIMPKSLSVPLLVPAVSGIAMIYGLPDEGLIYVKQWGYSVYKTTSKRAMDKGVEELFYEIRQKGYKNLILLDYKNGEFLKDFIDESNIEQYEGKIYKLFRKLYYYSFGESVKFEKLHNIVTGLRDEEMTISEVIPKIILDDESLINLKDNKDFIEFLYLVLLDREPDEKGLYHWISEIENGRTRKEIINFFLNSPEFIQNINI
ncbi:MAG: DUF4214 domain-containing protein [Actinomycetota bacterium]